MVAIVLSSADNSVSMGNNVSLAGAGELSDLQESSLGMVSDEVRLIFQAMNFAVICQLMDIFGTCTNIVNVVVFVKQGFKDSVNVSLMALAVSDLGMLGTLIWHNLCFNPLFHEADLPFDSIEMQYLTGGWPHVVFTRITSWITAFITLERCLCIALPLKIKSALTPKRVTAIMVTIFLLLIGSVSPVYYANRYGLKFFPDRNKTLIGLIYTPDREQVEKVSFTINNIIIPFTAFLTILACTIVLVVKLRQQTKWRKNTKPTAHVDTLSSRDQKVTRMVVMISALFIVCFTPICVVFIGMTVEPELAINGKYHNMFFVVFSFGYILESTNSAINIFIYYRMSSRYRQVFRQIFCRGGKVVKHNTRPTNTSETGSNLPRRSQALDLKEDIDR
ncbi:allatostatin-A receptor-like [Physella acuta]|uniref:allatostatin-A receptor-like n=1 Tax=Physella acuta TaxID=109671 RepID=UPI0027DD48A8|nr:allatostatin-A receptor-like [Physella acuta]